MGYHIAVQNWPFIEYEILQTTFFISNEIEFVFLVALKRKFFDC